MALKIAYSMTDPVIFLDDRPRVGWINEFSFITSTGAWEGTTGVEDAQGTPTQSHISPIILVCGG